MKRILVTVTTYDRAEMLRSLVEDLFREGVASSRTSAVHVVVYDDGTPKSRQFQARHVEVPPGHDMTIYRFPTNGGKAGYWRRWNTILSHVSAYMRKGYGYHIALPDDVRLAPGFFDRAAEMWDALALHDERAACLNLLLDREREGKASWIRHDVRRVQVGPFEFWHTQWNDLCLISDGRFGEALRHRISPVRTDRWRRDPLSSSGVGSQVTRRLHADGHRLYQVTETLVYHGQHLSKMNPRARAKAPLTALPRTPCEPPTSATRAGGRQP